MILILNNKANLNYDEIKYYEKNLRKYNLIILPTNCYLSLFQKGKYILGSQDISEFTETKRTGEINGKQLKSLNVKYTLIAHSDRRIYNKETDESILNKIKRCIENNITPIYCISELDNDLKEQIDLLENNFQKENIIYAYEPIENIGSSIPKLDDIEDKINYIKKYIKEKYNKEIILIYGGGVNVSNIEYLKNILGIDGVILSTDSLNLNNLKEIYDKARK